MVDFTIKIFTSSDEIHVTIGGNDYYYDKSITEAEAVIRSVFKFYEYNPDYYLDGTDFE